MKTLQLEPEVARNRPKQLLSQRLARQQGVQPSGLAQVQREALAEFRRRLDEGAYRLEHEPCPCGVSAEEAVLAEIDRYGLPLDSVLCFACGTVRLDPHLDAASLDDFYRTLYQAMYGRFIEPAAYFERQRTYGRRILATCFGQAQQPQRRVLEVGCGAGGGLAVFQEQGHFTAGCELDPQLIAFGAGRGVKNLHVGTLAETAGSTGAAQFDLIYLHHVFEHVDRPLPLIGELAPLVAPGGRVLIIVPDLLRIDRFRNPAGDALAFFHVAHKYNYSPLGIRRLAAQAGMTARRIEPARGIKTPWSSMPELWMELRPGEPSETPAEADSHQPGLAVLRYLQRTERRYQWGLCPAQILRQVRDLSPRKLAKRIAGSFRRR